MENKTIEKGRAILGLYHFQLLYDIMQDIHCIYDEKKLAEYVLEKLSIAFNAEGGTIFRLEPDGKLYPVASYGVPLEELQKLEFEVGKGVVGWVLKYMQPVRVINPLSDPRFYGSIDLATGFKTRSIIATPIVSKNKPLGAIEFLNRRDRPFVLQDLELISMMGRELGIVLDNIKLITELEQKQAFHVAVTESLSTGLIVVSTEGKLLDFNLRAREILRIEELKLDGTVPVEKALSKYPEFVTAIKQVITSENPLNRKEVNVTIDGKNAKIGYSGVPVRNKKNIRLGSAILFQDITNIKK